MLQRVIANMPNQEAKYHMKRCVDSGLWQPSQDDPNTNPEDGFKRSEKPDEEEETTEAVYESVPVKEDDSPKE